MAIAKLANIARAIALVASRVLVADIVTAAAIRGVGVEIDTLAIAAAGTCLGSKLGSAVVKARAAVLRRDIAIDTVAAAHTVELARASVDRAWGAAILGVIGLGIVLALCTAP